MRLTTAPLRSAQLAAVLALFSTAAARANLVVNGDFETHIVCPSNFGNPTDATGWSSPSLGSPDYFNSCAGNNTFGTPTNAFGTEAPHSGDGYGHIRVYGNLAQGHPSEDYREYLQGTLTAPLSPGVTYNVSFFVSRVEASSAYAIEDMGVYFSSTPTLVGHDKVISVTPQVINTSGYLTTSVGWTQVTGSFTATGGEQFLIIGNFQTDAATNSSLVSGVPIPLALYYVDDVGVEAVPEPGAMSLAIAAGLLLWCRWRQSLPESRQNL